MGHTRLLAVWTRVAHTVAPLLVGAAHFTRLPSPGRLAMRAELAYNVGHLGWGACADCSFFTKVATSLVVIWLRARWADFARDACGASIPKAERYARHASAGLDR